jgi:hypothetical protein
MVTSAVFDAEAAASRVVAALLPLADAQRAGQKEFCPRSRPRSFGSVVKDSIQRSFRENSANPE